MKVAVYCGSKCGNDPAFLQAAKELGRWIGSGGNTLVYGGATEWGEGLLGAEIKAPLSDSLSLKGSAGCVFSRNRGSMRSVKQEEGWNIAVGLSWSPGGKARMGADMGGPLFEVADNGSFLQNYRRSSSSMGPNFNTDSEEP